MVQVTVKKSASMMKTDLRDYSKSRAGEEISDPLELCKSISHLLNKRGGVAGPSEVTKIVGLMRKTQNLVGRCVFLNILRVTRNEEVFDKFMTDGGWKILNKWFSAAKETDNLPVIQDILKILNRLPVTIQHLRENNTPKIVKHFAKSSNSKLKSSASVLMQSWMAIITGGSVSLVEGSEPPKRKKMMSEEKPVKSKPGNKSTPPPVMKAPSFAKFRKTGLETEQILPRKKLKSNQSGKRIITENETSVPEKKAKPAPKKVMLFEGEGFMDALNSASNPVPLGTKKMKRRPLKTASNFGNSSKSTDQNTENVAGDASDFSATELLRKLSPKRDSSPVLSEPVKPKLNKYGKPMKRVQFKSDEYLESVRYFEVDENERVNVSTQSFKDAQHREMMIERQLMKGGKIPSYAGEDGGEGEWTRPALIDDLPVLVEAGCNSVEKDIQTEREKSVLMSIFLTREMVPDSPMEPDPEPYEIMQPKIIPFDDETAVAELMDPEAESGTSANDVIMKNMLSGLQSQDNSDLTEKLKQILQTASGIQATNTSDVAPDPAMMQQSAPGMWTGGEMVPQGNPQMGMVDMNGQQMQPQAGFYGSQMMVPVQDPNFYAPNWSGPPPHHNNGPPMHPPPPMFNHGWGGPPRWRGGPPPRGGRNDYRGNHRGRWNDGRRR